jgi:drug/metabolite transporter (DMT)-like permease
VPEHRRGLLIVAAGVVLLSPDALLIRLLPLGAWSIVFWRGLASTAGLCLLGLLLWRRRLGARFLGIGAWGLLAAGLSAASGTLFVVSVTHTSVAHTLLIVAASPLFGAVSSAIFLGEQVRAATWAACLAVLAGIGAIVRTSLGSPHLVGDLAALAVAISASSMFVVLRHRRHVEMIPAVTLSGLISAAVAAPWGAVFSLTAREVAVVALLGLMLPVSLALLTRGPRYLAAPEIGLLMLLETVLGPIWVWLVLGEQPGVQTLLCGALILSVLAVHSGLVLAGWTRPEILPP